jgi:hypothetical protein
MTHRWCHCLALPKLNTEKVVKYTIHTHTHIHTHKWKCYV